jgi:hypothetical protein
MTDVLGYPKYALHATDWVSLVTFLQDFFGSRIIQGADIGYRMYESLNATVRAAHFVFFQFQPPSPKEIADKNITLSKVQKIALEHTMAWLTTGQGYFMEQTYKVPSRFGSVFRPAELINYHCTAQRHRSRVVRQSRRAIGLDRGYHQALV